jgi:hypothetical protein
VKIRIEKEVSIASAFQHLIAAWDAGPFPWYRKVCYSMVGSKAIDTGKEPISTTQLAILTMAHPDGDDVIDLRIDGEWIKQTLETCLARGPGNYVCEAALKIINEDSAADQNTADLVMQVGAYGQVVFG